MCEDEDGPEVAERHRLLSTLARHGRLAAAATLFSTALRTTRALNSLLAALCSSSSSLRIAPRILLLAAPSASPDAATFRILTSALCRARRPAAAVDLLRCMPSLLLDPDPPLCRAVLSSLCHSAPARHAAAFLHDMRRWGVSPSRYDHRAVVAALLREGMAAEAYEVLRSSDGVAPPAMDADLVAPILGAFSARSEFDAVEEVFDEMLLSGLVPGVAVYNAYVGALCAKGDVAGARRMAESCMERAGCPPDVTTFGVVVAGCVSAGDMGAARETAREAARRGLRWDALALSELVASLRARGCLAQARPLLLEMLVNGWCAPLDAAAFGTLMRALCLGDDGRCDGGRRDAPADGAGGIGAGNVAAAAELDLV